MKSLEIYLTFNGNCAEAFEFYASVFGGEIIMMNKFSEMPPNPDFPVPEDQMDNVMHVTMQLKSGVILMGSDTGGREANVGDNFSISINADTREEVDSLFAALSEGGEPQMPPSEMFWGSYFGTCRDKFNINWMFSFDVNNPG